MLLPKSAPHHPLSHAGRGASDAGIPAPPSPPSGGRGWGWGRTASTILHLPLTPSPLSPRGGEGSPAPDTRCRDSGSLPPPSGGRDGGGGRRRLLFSICPLTPQPLSHAGERGVRRRILGAEIPAPLPPSEWGKGLGDRGRAARFTHHLPSPPPSPTGRGESGAGYRCRDSAPLPPSEWGKGWGMGEKAPNSLLRLHAVLAGQVRLLGHRQLVLALQAEDLFHRDDLVL